jgi:3-oxoacyl-(acyl-carrier-protein) synthase
LKGPNTTVSSGCNSGLDATYLAYNAILSGDADLMIVGAGECPITPCTFAIFCASGFLSRENAYPQKAVKPYDSNADGMVLGEGGGVLIMEELQHALNRKARIYGEMVSYSSLNEAFDLFGVETENGTMALNLERALKRANINFSEVDYISAHGNGILPYDISETEAIKQVFGEMAYNIPVSSIKPVTAHSISATGIFQIIASLLAIRKGIVPPTINVEKPDPKCDLDYVRNGYLKKKIQTALINAHGFGGRLTVIIIRQFPFEKSIA